MAGGWRGFLGLPWLCRRRSFHPLRHVHGFQTAVPLTRHMVIFYTKNRFFDRKLPHFRFLSKNITCLFPEIIIFIVAKFCRSKWQGRLQVR
jgi:hypothetical protein